MSHTIRRLPDTELEVMQALWASDTPVPRAQLEERLAQTHPMATTTLLTLLSRLSEKGFVRVDKEGRKSLYAPLVTREDYLAAQSRSFIQKLCGGSLSTFASALCDSGLSKEELEELRELLKEGD
ncbi:BlaI/MecI/CopY family transcriptional regulator [Pseudoflavonifractor capillosus]|uniref:BlaI/MecI/CopY family transcriptional regulator n=1 Tax=Pseudoflavonifractor TaxID=1017280 RepID=UPI000B36C574|nr:MULTISPECIES: BlaI/MecI/CopY family transcriptional regulator [Pseudoflavonifractor]MBM6695189.1 BlaI/MecI/CopY family transcriptional regulator [Pseudoflavonifractor capillosus]OUN96702.1 transcriptional regulator [Pseudoflavonifractor sp. An44]OUP65081.1 transcriptional regulator [Pseudoflavonifractor sp. An176]